MQYLMNKVRSEQLTSAEEAKLTNFLDRISPVAPKPSTPARLPHKAPLSSLPFSVSQFAEGHLSPTPMYAPRMALSSSTSSPFPSSSHSPSPSPPSSSSIRPSVSRTSPVQAPISGLPGQPGTTRNPELHRLDLDPARVNTGPAPYVTVIDVPNNDTGKKRTWLITDDLLMVECARTVGRPNKTAWKMFIEQLFARHLSVYGLEAGAVEDNVSKVASRWHAMTTKLYKSSVTAPPYKLENPPDLLKEAVCGTGSTESARTLLWAKFVTLVEGEWKSVQDSVLALMKDELLDDSAAKKTVTEVTKELKEALASRKDARKDARNETLKISRKKEAESVALQREQQLQLNQGLLQMMGTLNAQMGPLVEVLTRSLGTVVASSRPPSRN